VLTFEDVLGVDVYTLKGAMLEELGAQTGEQTERNGEQPRVRGD